MDTIATVSSTLEPALTCPPAATAPLTTDFAGSGSPTALSMSTVSVWNTAPL